MGLSQVMVTDARKGSMATKSLVPLLPSRKFKFRKHGEATWKRYEFSILGDKKVLAATRSSRPMHLLLATNIDGFRSTEIVGLDLFAAISSAMLTAESLMIMLGQSGDIELRADVEFDVASDSVFFGDRIQRLRRTLQTIRTQGGPAPDAEKSVPE
jgi:hypothetical protein